MKIYRYLCITHLKQFNRSCGVCEQFPAEILLNDLTILKKTEKRNKNFEIGWR